jgi:hypothetical protein
VPEVSLLAILAATIAAFVLSSTYYSVLPAQSEPGATGDGPPPWKLGAELLRSLTLTTVVAGLASQGGIDEWTGGLLLGLSLWIGFPLVLWTGAPCSGRTRPGGSPRSTAATGSRSCCSSA